MDEGAGIPAHRASRQVAASLRELDVRPSRGQGQNFLTSTSVVQRIVDLTEATIEDTIVEVGPGLGALTRYWPTERAGSWRSKSINVSPNISSRRCLHRI
ncbi:MAG: rRNA adenine N-6-methyltransferase family protein [Thermomicrobiales bacterium]